MKLKTLLCWLFCQNVHIKAFSPWSQKILILLFAEDLTETGLGSLSSTGGKKAEVHVAGTLEVGEEEVEGEEAEEEAADLNCLQRSWMPS